jgi:murein DD-endopeptidase MepM/ murein hydrolase activator NlpD
VRRSAARLIAAVVTVAAVVVGVIPAGAVTWEEVEAAREKLREVTTELEGQVTAYEGAVLREDQLQQRLEQITTDLDASRRVLTLTRRAARDRVAEMYMAGTTPGADTTAMLAVEEFSELPARLAYLDSVADTDRAVATQLEAARLGMIRHQQMLEEVSAEHAMVRAELEDLLEQIYTRLEEADQEYREVRAAWEAQEAERIRREEEERRRREREAFLATSTTTTVAPPPTAAPAADAPAAAAAPATTAAPPPPPPPPPPPSPPGTRVCPVDGAVSFRDSWGEPRPGGRSHTGTDMVAALGTPLVAIEAGTIRNMSFHYAGGIGLDIITDGGIRWYYAHLNGYAPGIAEGTRVVAGQVVGYVGETGNARNPHLHLAYAPGGGYHENPYPIVAALC